MSNVGYVNIIKVALFKVTSDTFIKSVYLIGQRFESVCCQQPLYVSEHPPEMDKNEWEVIGTVRNIYTVSNTTQFGVVSIKVDCKCHMVNAKCSIPKIQQMASALHCDFSYCKCNTSQDPRVKNIQKRITPLKKCFLDLFSKFFRFCVNYTCVRTV